MRRRDRMFILGLILGISIGVFIPTSIMLENMGGEAYKRYGTKYGNIVNKDLTPPVLMIKKSEFQEINGKFISQLLFSFVDPQSELASLSLFDMDNPDEEIHRGEISNDVMRRTYDWKCDTNNRCDVVYVQENKYDLYVPKKFEIIVENEAGMKTKKQVKLYEHKGPYNPGEFFPDIDESVFEIADDLVFENEVSNENQTINDSNNTA